MLTVAIILVAVGIIGLLATLVLVYKPLNVAQLSMSAISGATQEHHQGLSYKAPWATLQKPEINMQAKIIITSGGILLMSWDKFISEKVYEKISPRVYEAKGQIPMYGSWATAIRPLKGYLNNFVLKTPQVGALMTMSGIDIVISDYIATREVQDVLHNKKAISDLLAKTFEGENTSTAFEKSYGIMVFDPKLFDLNLGKKSQDASEKLFESQKFREAVVDMKTAQPDADKATNAVLIATGMAKKNVFQVEGLEGALIGMAKSIADAFIAKNNKRKP
jgi:hypothetical protein